MHDVDLDMDAISAAGIAVSGTRKGTNGERRFRLMMGERDAGHGYIMTVMDPEQPGGWQNSHSHQHIQETYIVQEGWIGFADLMPDGTAKFYVYGRGMLFTTRPGQSHNVYMPSGAVIHTVKHGNVGIGRDWVPSPELDSLTRNLTEEELLQIAQ